MVLDERKESFLTDPDAEQGRIVLGSAATWAEQGVVLNAKGKFFYNRSGAGKLLSYLTRPSCQVFWKAHHHCDL